MSDFKTEESDFQKLLKVYDADKSSLENATDAYLIKSPAVCLDESYKIFFMTLRAEKKVGYRLAESKLCGLTSPKRRLDKILDSARANGETRIKIPRLVIPTRDEFNLHLETDITLVEQGAIVLIKNAYKRDPKSIFARLFQRNYPRDVYIEAKKVIDFEDKEGAKKAWEIHRAYVNSYIEDSSRKIIVDISCTERISKSCLNAFACWAMNMKNFYLANPSEEIYEQLIDEKIDFPKENIILEEKAQDSKEVNVIPASV